MRSGDFRLCGAVLLFLATRGLLARDHSGGLVLMIFNNLINRKSPAETDGKDRGPRKSLVESLSNQLSLRALHLQNWATLKTETRFVDLLRAAWQATIRTQFVSSSTNFVTSLRHRSALVGRGFGARFEDDRRRDDVVLHPLGLYCRAGHGVAQRQSRFAAGVDRGRSPFEIMDLDVEADSGIVVYTPARGNGFKR
jgi:hypothetical protein